MSKELRGRLTVEVQPAYLMSDRTEILSLNMVARGKPLAPDGVPPPDVFASGDGGVQLEWHIRGVDVTVAFSAFDEQASIHYHDLRDGGEPWCGPVSDGRLRVIRKRLLENP